MTMASLIKLFGFDRDEDQRISAELLQQHQLFFMINFKNSSESYSMDLNQLHKLPEQERMRLIREVEAENIEFDMIEKIKRSPDIDIFGKFPDSEADDILGIGSIAEEIGAAAESLEHGLGHLFAQQFQNISSGFVV